MTTYDPETRTLTLWQIGRDGDVYSIATMSNYDPPNPSEIQQCRAFTLLHFTDDSNPTECFDEP